MSVLEALLVGIVGTLIAVYICRERGHNAFPVITFFLALIFFGGFATFGSAGASLHLYSLAVGLTALAVILGNGIVLMAANSRVTSSIS